MKQDNLKVIYIAGNGHSGSTLLDIILGNLKPSEIFSAGEITNVVRASILDEYCSCGEKISNCDEWSTIFKVWESERQISYEEYAKLRNKYERNKTFLITLWNKVYPTSDFDIYCNATLELFKAIKKVTGKSVIIDSSKGPSRKCCTIENSKS